MKPVRVALAQIAPRLGDPKANLEKHAAAVKTARAEKAGVVVFPELAMTGYLLRDQVPDVAMSESSRALKSLLSLSRSIDLVTGLVMEGPDHAFFNAAIYASQGRLVHVHRKVYLPTYGMFDEGRDFAAGEVLRAFDAPFGRAGILICEDAWHPTCAWLTVLDGASTLFVPSSGPTRGARPGKGITSVPVWHDLLRGTAQFQTAFVVYVNRVGYEDGLSFGGGSIAIDPFGRTIASLPALEEGLAVAELSPEVLRRARTVYPLLRDENVDLVSRELERVRRKRFALPDPDEETP
jgi:predicted amidohydrolase